MGISSPKDPRLRITCLFMKLAAHHHGLQAQGLRHTQILLGSHQWPGVGNVWGKNGVLGLGVLSGFSNKIQ